MFCVSNRARRGGELYDPRPFHLSHTPTRVVYQSNLFSVVSASSRSFCTFFLR
jgi:hypothetical protein